MNNLEKNIHEFFRMYQPRTEILDGSWQFPAIKPID